MKDVLKNRVKRLEEILKGEDNLCMIAKQDKDGFHWNGVTYANQKELSAAVRLTVGNYPEVPLLIISNLHAEVGGDYERAIQ
jgi:hypothetical protein